jgi:uridine phosphorylase
MGGPSAAIVAEELIDLGAQTLLRIGTCGGLVDGLALGELLAVREALAADGTSRALGAEERVAGSEEVFDACVAAGAKPATAVTSDLFYDPREDAQRGWVEAGAVAVEMETAAVFTVARRRGVRAGALLAVTDLVAGARERMDQEAVEEVGVELGRTALHALARLA